MTAEERQADRMPGGEHRARQRRPGSFIHATREAVKKEREGVMVETLLELLTAGFALSKTYTCKSL